MYNYCTLFDSKYLIRGLAMYESLKKHTKDFHLYVFPFDDLAYQILQQLGLDNVTVVPLSEFEDEELLKVKPTRTKGEYCWTATPSIILYCIEKFNLDNCTYLDSDIYFYSDPSVIIKEMGDKSVLITPHWYTPEYDQSATSGIYCVQFVTFKSTSCALEVLKWWRSACLNWCYARFEDGKFGDQKYLDDWPERFSCIHVLRNRGGGVAPWNVQQYNLEELKVIFYHYHYLKIYQNFVDLSTYRLPKQIIFNYYFPYLRHLYEIFWNLKKLGFNISFYDSVFKLDYKLPLRWLKRLFKKSLHIYSFEKIITHGSLKEWQKF